MDVMDKFMESNSESKGSFFGALSEDLKKNNIYNDEGMDVEDMSFLEKGKEETTKEAPEEAAENTTDEDYSEIKEDENDAPEDEIEYPEDDEEPRRTKDNESEPVYSQKQATKLIGCSSQTVRNYTKEFPELITPIFYSDTPTPFYDDKDIKIMREIKKWKDKKLNRDAIIAKLKLDFNIPDKNTPSTTEKQNITPDDIAGIITAKIEERLMSVFEYEVKNVTTRIDGVSNSIDEINGLLKSNTEALNRHESMTRNLEGAVSRSADVVSELQRNVTSKIDRSMSRNDSSFNKLQESLDRNNEIMQKELKLKLDDNKNSLNGLQKDMDRIKSNNLNKKVDDLGKSIQESMEREKKEREEQNKELIKIINEALTPPEYHPEESKEYKKLSENYEKTRQALEKARSAVENMNSRLNEQDEKMQEKESLISSQVSQISALNSQVQRLKALNKKMNRRLERMEQTSIHAPVIMESTERKDIPFVEKVELNTEVPPAPTAETLAEVPESVPDTNIEQDNTDINTAESTVSDMLPEIIPEDNTDGPDAMDMLNDLKKSLGKEVEVLDLKKKDPPPKKRKKFLGIF